jgi:hypothetical protein
MGLSFVDLTLAKDENIGRAMLKGILATIF